MKGGAKLYSQYGLLYDASRDTNSAPTQGAREQHAELKKELDKLLAEYKGLIDGELVKINSKARELDVARIIVPPIKPVKD